jgi:uncharacterized membrane protein
MALKEYLVPPTETVRPTMDNKLKASAKDPRPFELGVLYVRSYLLLRTAIGALGLALPVLVVLGDLLLQGAADFPRSSLSAYYHSGVRDVFVGVLCATALFLFTYKAFERNGDNILSSLAGLAALGVAVLPTTRPSTTAVLTPLQDLLGEQVVAFMHFTCAVVFIGLLGVLSWFFGRREGSRTQERNGYRARCGPTFWMRFHRVCAAVIGLAVAFIALSKWTGFLASHSVLIGGVVAVLAFGVSWLAKGWEQPVLWPQAAAEAAAGPGQEARPVASPVR